MLSANSLHFPLPYRGCLLLGKTKRKKTLKNSMAVFFFLWNSRVGQWIVVIVQRQSPPGLTGPEDVSKAGLSLTQWAGVGCWWGASVPPSLGPLHRLPSVFTVSPLSSLRTRSPRASEPDEG